MKTKKETRGGTRKGSGAKPKYDEPTKTIAFRVPISRIEHVKCLLKTLLVAVFYSLLIEFYESIDNTRREPNSNGSVFKCRT